MSYGISQAQKGRKAPPGSAPLVAPIKNKGMMHMSRDQLKNLAKAVSESKSLLFVVETPDGRIIKGKNLRMFCRQHGLDQSTLSRTAPGQKRHGKRHYGYRLVEPTNTAFVSLSAVARFLKITRASAKTLRDKNPTMFFEVVENMKSQNIIPSALNPFPESNS